MKAVYFGDKSLSDVVLVVDNHEFYVHKMVSFLDLVKCYIFRF